MEVRQTKLNPVKARDESSQISNTTMINEQELEMNDLDQQEDSFEIKTKFISYVFSLINRQKKLKFGTAQISEFEMDGSISDELEFVKIALPRLQLNIDKIQLVNFSSDLVYGLNLTIKQRSIIGSKLVIFNSDVTYNEDEGLKFRRSIVEKKGYLESDENYFNLKEDLVTKGTKVVTLINTRVILFWRDVDLSELTVKRILSLGLLFLIKKMSYAELFFEINRLLPNGRYNVSIKSVDNSYVLIGIELPIF